MKNNPDPIVAAFTAWDNHRQDCKATILDNDKEAGEGAKRKVNHPCVYDGDKCERGMKLYNTWRRAIGAVPSEPKVRSTSTEI